MLLMLHFSSTRYQGEQKVYILNPSTASVGYMVITLHIVESSR